MKHIRSKMILFMLAMVMLAWILINVSNLFIFTKRYTEELYISSLQTVGQISQNVDNVIRTVETSLQLTFSTKRILDTLNKADFKKADGEVFEFAKNMDENLRQLQNQLRSFRSAIIVTPSAGKYGFDYYSPNIDSLNQYEWYPDFETPYKQKECKWWGVYPTGNEYYMSAFPPEDKKFVVTKQVIDDNKLKRVAFVCVFLDASVFSSIYADVNNTTGNTVIMLDSNNNPMIECNESDKEALSSLFKYESFKSEDSGHVINKIDGERKLITYVRSADTGWVMLEIKPLNTLMQPIYLSALVSTALGLLTVVFLAIVIVWWVSRFSKSIVDVASAMKQVENHNLDIHLQVRSKDEIAIIYNGFNNMVLSINDLISEVIAQENHKKCAEIRAMQYQIKPHFLYNTLASIRLYAIREGSMEIANMLTVLNRLLRNTINVHDHFISLGDELANLRDYVAIEQIRYSNKLNVIYDVSDELLDCKVPNMILQPLVENAVEHAFGNTDIPLENNNTISIRITLEEDLVIEITDNGVGMTDMEIMSVLKGGDEQQSDSHIGIRNISERLKMLFGNEYGITIRSQKGYYTTVVLRISLK